jgi:glycerol-3-phosphate O-acyltransferase
VLGEPRPGMQVSALDVQKIAFRLSVDANAVTPVLGTSLIAWILTAASGRALALSELAAELRALAQLVRAMQLPTSGEIEYANRELLQGTLGQLVHTGVLLRFEGAREPLYGIAPGAVMAAAYYRNAMAHFLVVGAIAELALLEAAPATGVPPRERLHAHALRLRDLLKYEFFFHEKSEFLAEIEQDLDQRLGGWSSALAEGPRAVHALVCALQPPLGPGTLRPFLDSYLVVAEALLLADAETAGDAKGMIRFCMRLGHERALQHRISSEESAAKAYLENGLLVARARGLFAGDEDAREAARRAHHDELLALSHHLALLATLAANRRLGVDREALEASL